MNGGGDADRRVGAFASGRDVPVPLGDIEQELSRLWRDLADRTEAASTVYRACILNLVIHAGDGPSEVAARVLASELTDRLPARVILLRARPEEAGGGDPRAWVSSISEPGTGGRRVSGELVVIEASGADLPRVPPLVRALLVPDMAVTLWWTGAPPPPLPYTEELHALADRVVVDTDTLADDVDLAHLLPRDPGGPCRVADLAWPRLACWRRAVARVFDDPARRVLLDGVRRAEITVGAPAAGALHSSSGPLLAGWVAAALGWRDCVRDRADALCFGTGDGAASIRILRRDGADVGVVALLLATDTGEVRFTRHDDPPRVVATDGDDVILETPLAAPDEARVLAETLVDLHADPIAPVAIRRAAGISAVLGAAS